MKNLKELGIILGKEEQKNIFGGGPFEPIPMDCMSEAQCNVRCSAGCTLSHYEIVDDVPCHEWTIPSPCPVEYTQVACYSCGFDHDL